MNSPPTLQQFEITQLVAEALVRNREHAHAHVMSGLERVTDSEGVNCPRSFTGTLWYLNEKERELLVQTKDPLQKPELLGALVTQHLVAAPEVGDQIGLALLCNAQYSPSPNVSSELSATIKSVTGKAYRSKLVIVPEEERIAWATRKLERIGFAVSPDLKVGRLQTLMLGGRNKRIPAVEITGTGTVTDAEAFKNAVIGGVGKAKNYGLGLIRITN